MEQAIRQAAEDAGAPKLVESLDAIYVPRGLWRCGNPARMLAERLGSPGAQTMLGTICGHIVQILLDRACREIAEGRCDIIAIVGGENENSKRRLQRNKQPIPWNEEIPGTVDAEVGTMKFVYTKDEATVESYTVPVGHDSPERAIFAALTDAGERVWGFSEDPELMAALLDDEDACGRRAHFRDCHARLL